MDFSSGAFSPHFFTGYHPTASHGQLIDPLAAAAAMGLPAPRRQNVACDQCRNRKVKCMQVPGQDKCQHCIQKNIQCTHVVQQMTSERKRTQQVQRRMRGVSSSESQSGPNVESSALTARRSSSQPTVSPIVQLIAYLLSPENSTSVPDFIAAPYTRSSTSPAREEWGDYGKRLVEDESYRIEFAWDLVEAFFQICYARLPFINPEDFRASLRAALPPLATPAQPGTTFTHPSFPPGKLSRNGVLAPALLAVVLAWGAKFADHAVLARDRQTNGGRSVIARTLLRKARHVADAEHIHQISTADNVIVALLLEPLQSHNQSDSDAVHGFYLSAAIRHMFELRINSRTFVNNITDYGLRSTMVFAWWVASISDAHACVWFRRKPMVDEEDCNLDFFHFNMPVLGGSPRSTPEEQQQYLLWWIASNEQAVLARQISRILWIPRTEAEGVPFERLRFLITNLNQWRDQHLARFGMPNYANADWGFLEAVNMSSNDALYHIFWVVLFNAVEEFGIKELRDAGLTVSMTSDSPVASEIPGHSVAALDPVLISQIEEVRGTLQNEAGLGALRIAELVNVLAQQNYLRLDPNIVHYALYCAGLHLARLGRPETVTCVSGLRQYGIAYEDAFEQADEIERLYAPSGSSASGSPPGSAAGAPQSHTHFMQPQPFGYDMFAHTAGADALMALADPQPTSSDFGGLFGHTSAGPGSPSGLVASPHHTPPQQHQQASGGMSPFALY